MRKQSVWESVPTVDDVLDEIRGDDENLLRAEWIRRVVITASKGEAWGVLSGTVKVWYVMIPYGTPFRNSTFLFTIVQCVEGGISNGDGWARCRRWVIRGRRLSTEELIVLVPLMVGGYLPEITFEDEL